MTHYIMYTSTPNGLPEISPLTFTDMDDAVSSAKQLLNEHPAYQISILQSAAFIKMDCVINYDKGRHNIDEPFKPYR